MTSLNKNDKFKNRNNKKPLLDKEVLNGPIFNEEDLKDLRNKRIEIFTRELGISKSEAEKWADENLKFYREELEAFA